MHLCFPLGTCFRSRLIARCCAKQIFGLGAAAFWSVTSAARIPPASSHHIQIIFKAKQLFKSEFSGRHKCSCLIVEITCKLDRGSFPMMARSNVINQCKFKALLAFLCLIPMKMHCVILVWILVAFIRIPIFYLQVLRHR